MDNTRVSCHFLLQGIFMTQGLKPNLLHCRQILYCLSHQGSPFFWEVKVKVLVTQLCRTLCNPMDCSLPGFSIHVIFQARILEWVAISFFRGSSQPKDQTRISSIADTSFPSESLGKTFFGKVTNKNFDLLFYFGVGVGRVFVSFLLRVLF